MKVVADKKAEEASVENAGTIKKSKVALIGVKKGALAAKQAAARMASAPSKIFDDALYHACYGISYGAVFTSLAVVKILPISSLMKRGFHDGARIARKDFKTSQEKHIAHEDSAVVS